MDERMSGLSVCQSPAESDGLWYELTDLHDGRVGVVVGSCPDPSLVPGLRGQTAAALRTTTDPLQALDGIATSTAAILAAVIDRIDAQLSYSSLGGASPALAAPGLQTRVLESAEGRLARTAVPAGSAVLLCAGDVLGAAAVLLDGSDNLREAIEQLIAEVASEQSVAGVVTVVYRQAPDPLEITVAAEPDSLALLRNRLREWLARTDAGNEVRADVLLAVGEAASNAAEHACIAADGPVQMTMCARVDGDALLFTVSDNGCWKVPAADPGHRGHGIRLIEALVDEAEVITADCGTTVEMRKELR